MVKWLVEDVTVLGKSTIKKGVRAMSAFKGLKVMSTLSTFQDPECLYSAFKDFHLGSLEISL